MNIQEADFIVVDDVRVITNPRFDGDELRSALITLKNRVLSESSVTLQGGRHLTVRVDLPGGIDAVVKSFGRQGPIRDRISWRKGSKAFRTYRNALHLDSKGIGTPLPVAVVERWKGRSLLESYYVSIYVEGVVSFRDHLIDLFKNNSDCGRFMSLFQHVAEALSGMHDAGFLHYDLGNQNILLQSTGGEEWGRVLLIDLNRGSCGESAATPAARARDLSRLSLPSDFRRVFLEMYCRGEVPSRFFLKREQLYRRLFSLHTVTRIWRRPIREWRKRREPAEDDYPLPRDMWVWDERSVQAVSTMVSKDRHKYYPASRVWYYVKGVFCCLFKALMAYRRIRKLSFSGEGGRKIKEGVSVAITARSESFPRELLLLKELGVRNVWIRLYHHESAERSEFACQCVDKLYGEGFNVSIALVQDRRAVNYPAEWESFCALILERVSGNVCYVEYLHAINRVKWGLWGFEDLRSLLSVLERLQRRFPDVSFTGPAVIDFEEEYLAAVSGVMPAGVHFSALSHLLYVDRRGAPENSQRGYNLADKLALLRGFAGSVSYCEPRVIVSEFNWPLEGTGVYSPVTSPYDSPGKRRKDPSVSEYLYACYIIRYLILAISSGHVEMAVLWRLAARGFGLVDDLDNTEWRVRPAFTALKVFLAELGEYVFERRIDISGSDTDCYCMQFRDSKGDIKYALWRNGDEMRVEIPVRYSSAVGMDGAVLPLSDSITVGAAPVYLV